MSRRNCDKLLMVKNKIFLSTSSKKRKANRAICEYIGSDIICGRKGVEKTIKVLCSGGREKEGMDG